MAANKAKAIEEPDWANLSLQERADWFLPLLRQMPGSAYEHEGVLWHRLDAENLLEVMGGLAPGLEESLIRGARNHLGKQGLRYSINKGGGKYIHLIKPADDAAEVDDLEDLLVRGRAILSALREEVEALRARSAAQDRKVEELTAEVERLTSEATRRTQRPASVDLFRDGLGEAEKFLRK